jgi:hypothetical protein
MLVSQPETGMGYQIATVHLSDGRHYDRAIIVGGYITQVGEETEIPFAESDIARIVVDRFARFSGARL